MEIGEKKRTGRRFCSVRITLDEYENVLREIKNLDSNEELYELQRRIRANGLIANYARVISRQVMLASSR
jgi:hypothetical protein